MQITEYEEKYRDEVIRLILDIQNKEACINLPLEEQPDLTDISRFYKKDGVGVLKKFFVRADYRSQKIGLKLYLALLDFCASHSFRTLILDTPAVAADSHRFYEKNGFVRITKNDLPVSYDYPDRNSFLYIKQL